MRLRYTPFAVLLVLSGCAQPERSSLSEELRLESATTGLALVSMRSELAVIPFDGEEKHFQFPYPRASLLLGADGRTGMWTYQRNSLEPPQFAIDSAKGEIHIQKALRTADFTPVALNGKAGRLAFRGRPLGETSRTELGWLSFDFLTGGFVDDTDGYADWSPDGSQLAYEKQRQIRVFDMSRRSSSLLTEGRSPTWSPDGQQIAYRASNGRAALITVDGRALNWSLKAHEPLGPVRWSPDGRYVVFSEATKGLNIPFVTATEQVVVCRVSDGTSMVIKEFGPPAGAPGFFWIVDYRKFCTNCKAGRTDN